MELNFKNWLLEQVALTSGSGIKPVGTTGVISPVLKQPSQSSTQQGGGANADPNLEKNIRYVAGIIQRDVQLTGQNINKMTDTAIKNNKLTGIINMFRAYDAKNKKNLPQNDEVLAAAIKGLSASQGQTQGQTK